MLFQWSLFNKLQPQPSYIPSFLLYTIATTLRCHAQFCDVGTEIELAHHFDSNIGYFSPTMISTGNENEYNNSLNTYSQIGVITSNDPNIFQDSNNYYTFKLKYITIETNSTQILIWKQLSWLSTSPPTIGYTPINIPNRTNDWRIPFANFNGLTLCNANQAYLCSVHDALPNAWFNTVGTTQCNDCVTAFNNNGDQPDGIICFDSLTCWFMQLYVCQPPLTPSPTTSYPTTQNPTTSIPTTFTPTTMIPTTTIPSTSTPTTVIPTTSPTTLNPTTINPTTVNPTTINPTTINPTTINPTTINPTTSVPTTNEPTTNVPTTNVPTTNEPTTNVPTTNEPTTNVPTVNNDAEIGDVSTTEVYTDESSDQNESVRNSNLLGQDLIIMFIIIVIVFVCVCFVLFIMYYVYRKHQQKTQFDKDSQVMESQSPITNKTASHYNTTDAFNNCEKHNTAAQTNAFHNNLTNLSGVNNVLMDIDDVIVSTGGPHSSGDNEIELQDITTNVNGEQDLEVKINKQMNGIGNHVSNSASSHSVHGMTAGNDNIEINQYVNVMTPGNNMEEYNNHNVQDDEFIIQGDDGDDGFIEYNQNTTLQ